MGFVFQPARRMDLIKPSATLEVNRLAGELRSAGNEVISFALGEPDNLTPKFVNAAMATFALKGSHKYAPKVTPDPLADAICGKFKRDNRLEYKRQEVTTGAGGKELVFWSICTAVNPGDEVIIPAPYWVSYPEIVNFFEGVPVIVDPNPETLKVTGRDILAKVTDKTKMILLNSPSNPSSTMYTRDELLELAEIGREAAKISPNIVFLCDDIYEKLTYDTPFHTLAELAPDLKDRIIIINGLSKSHAFTGARFGYAAAQEAWIGQINKMITQSTTHTPTVVQAGAIAALNGDEGFLNEWRAGYRRRRDYVVGRLHAMGLPCTMPQGAFYAYPNISEFVGKKRGDVPLVTDKDVVLDLLRSKFVGCVHGSAFGTPGYVRISYATSDQNLETGLNRMAAYFQEIRNGNSR